METHLLQSGVKSTDFMNKIHLKSSKILLNYLKFIKQSNTSLFLGDVAITPWSGVTSCCCFVVVVAANDTTFHVGLSVVCIHMYCIMQGSCRTIRKPDGESTSVLVDEALVGVCQVMCGTGEKNMQIIDLLCNNIKSDYYYYYYTEETDAWSFLKTCSVYRSTHMETLKHAKYILYVAYGYYVVR